MNEHDIDTRNEVKNVVLRFGSRALIGAVFTVAIISLVLIFRVFAIDVTLPTINRLVLLVLFTLPALPLAFFALREMGAWGWIPRLWLIEKTTIVVFTLSSGVEILPHELIEIYSPYAFAILFLCTTIVITTLAYLRTQHDKAPKTLERIAEWDGPNALSAKPELLEQVKREVEKGS